MPAGGGPSVEAGGSRGGPQGRGVVGGAAASFKIGGSVPLRDEGESEAGLLQRADCLDTAGRFLDPDFGPTPASLFLDPAAPPAAHPPFDSLRFLRPHELPRRRSPSLFGEGGACGGVAQGAVGDGWFLSALCAVATRRDLLSVILPRFSGGDSGGVSERGIYTVRFYKYGQVRAAQPRASATVLAFMLGPRHPSHPSREKRGTHGTASRSETRYQVRPGCPAEPAAPPRRT